MRVEKGHAHAYTKYRLLVPADYLWLLRSALECKLLKHKSLTVHLPYEVQHPEVYNLKSAYKYISFGERLKKVFGIKLFWENAPWLNYGTWDLKYKNTDWQHVPFNIDLCLDTGHLMLGAKSTAKFQGSLSKLLKSRGNQIKYMHLHENNFKRDLHTPVPGKVITKKIFREITKGRQFILEKGE
jgi:sugar phosphate isomerase/epimerase